MSLLSARVLRSDRARMRVQTLLCAILLASGVRFVAFPVVQPCADDVGIAASEVVTAPDLLEADPPSRTTSTADANRRANPRVDPPIAAEANAFNATKAVSPSAESPAIVRRALATTARGYNATAPPRS